ncbi:type V toxin-antitoxin system endoribonuclease antitoxin GhoS [Leclercia adecarboxylata]|uniref:type V toxin-antitoxin system endoribonuclease antitoxin GhoS n=1 Tax=Leclercia adecarboxylata TaxID=83655 RepID=UPI002B2D9E02|nr:type V toxin-antitoxin system endoribonuclease antitoxin GhoS [Leclercia adecarboxylata]WNY86594.1 type V toxin-antitoxin system endoribonuclease antitoxin GhoS [Leclercia adecarboxylata]
MSRFTVRVELHNNQPDDYEELHEKMLAAGFVKTITEDDSGKTYKLPDAEYNYTSDEKKAEVAQKAYNIAKTVRKFPSVLVTKSAGRSWINLKPDE